MESNQPADPRLVIDAYLTDERRLLQVIGITTVVKGRVRRTKVKVRDCRSEAEFQLGSDMILAFYRPVTPEIPGIEPLGPSARS